MDAIDVVIITLTLMCVFVGLYAVFYTAFKVLGIFDDEE